MLFDDHQGEWNGKQFNNGMIRENLKKGSPGVVVQTMKRVDNAVDVADDVVFMKMDVEGFELQVLLGTTRLFGQLPLPIIYFEYSPEASYALVLVVRV